MCKLYLESFEVISAYSELNIESVTKNLVRVEKYFYYLRFRMHLGMIFADMFFFFMKESS